VNQSKTWPKSGAILWVGHSNSIEKTDGYAFGREALCEGHSRSLSLFEAKTHPDFYLIQPEKQGQSIKIDQIRALIEWAQAKPQISQRKVAIIYPADALNIQAANALLKILEELPLDSLFILMTAHISALPLTIVSRCHIIRDRVSIVPPQAQDDPVAQQVIHDLKALRRLEAEPTSVATAWLKKDINQILYWVIVVFNNFLVKAAENGKLTQTQSSFTFLDAVYDAKRAIQDKSNANEQLLIETLLIQYVLNLKE
jgi:DNA polymerase-3 subunit delta'